MKNHHKFFPPAPGGVQPWPPVFMWVRQYPSCKVIPYKSHLLQTGRQHPQCAHRTNEDGSLTTRVGPWCPDCGAQLINRTSEMESPLLRRIYFKCRNTMCGATFVGDLSITHRIRAPLKANPDFNIPYTSTAQNRMVEEAEKKQLKWKKKV